MDFNFDFRRLLLLTLLLGGFAWWGGFTAPAVPADGFHSPAAVRKGWTYCILLFVAGAVSASLVEHRVGLMDPTNLRPAYVLLGMVLMVAAGVWLRALKQGVEARGGVQTACVAGLTSPPAQTPPGGPG